MPLVTDSVDMTPQGAQMAALKDLHVLDSVTRWTADDVITLLTDEDRYLALQIVHEEITGSGQRLLQTFNTESSRLVISVAGIMDTDQTVVLKEKLAAVGHELQSSTQRGHGSHMVLIIGIIFKHSRA